MNIVVLIKQVPDTTEVTLDPKTGNLVREGVPSILNPDDLHALEAAVALRERTGEGTLIALTMGPPQAVDVLSDALGMGIDRGVLLTDRAFAGADTWATSSTLGKALEKLRPWDLILCGRQAIDGDTAQIGPQVADMLGIPHVSYVFDISPEGPGRLVVKRALEDGYERIATALPALLTVTGKLNTPRYPRVDRLLQACRDKAPLLVWNAADIGVKTQEVGLEGSLTHVIKTFSPKTRRQGEILEGKGRECVGALLQKLRTQRLMNA